MKSLVSASAEPADAASQVVKNLKLMYYHYLSQKSKLAFKDLVRTTYDIKFKDGNVATRQRYNRMVAVAKIIDDFYPADSQAYKFLASFCQRRFGMRIVLTPAEKKAEIQAKVTKAMVMSLVETLNTPGEKRRWESCRRQTKDLAPLLGGIEICQSDKKRVAAKKILLGPVDGTGTVAQIDDVENKGACFADLGAHVDLWRSAAVVANLEAQT